MSTNQKSSSGPIGIVVGLVLALVGGYIAVNVKIPALEDLAKKGVPLNPGETLATIGVFLMLFPVIKSFFVDPLDAAITDRTTHLEHTFTEAESLRTEMAQLKSDYEKRLAATEASAREQIQSQIKEAQNLRQQLMAEASSKADQMKAKASQEIEQERGKVLSELRVSAVDMTLKATEKLLGEIVDTDKNRKLVQDFIEKAEVAR